MSISPEHEETAVPADTSFVLTFDKVVYPEIAGISLREQLSTSNFQAFDFSDPLMYPLLVVSKYNFIYNTNPIARENFEFFTNYTLIIALQLKQ